jgi:carbonic anhydrase
MHSRRPFQVSSPGAPALRPACACHRDDVVGACSRRHVLRAAALAALAALSPRLAAAADPPPRLRPNAINPDEALRRLLDGNARYASNQMNERDFSSGRAARAKVQHPVAAVLGCADSRVAPELAFDQGPGELFAVRVAGNFVNDDGLASFEYAVQFLGVPLLLVLGHTSCGAVDAAIKAMKNRDKLPGHLPDLVRSIQPAVIRAERDRRGRDLLTDAIAENVRLNVSRLKSAGPVLKRAVAEGRLGVVGATYDLATGKVALVDA